MFNLHLIIEKQWKNPKMWGILHESWPGHFKIINVTKNKSGTKEGGVVED
jgi:hypothetical protein